MTSVAAHSGTDVAAVGAAVAVVLAASGAVPLQVSSHGRGVSYAAADAGPKRQKRL